MLPFCAIFPCNADRPVSCMCTCLLNKTASDPHAVSTRVVRNIGAVAAPNQPLSVCTYIYTYIFVLVALARMGIIPPSQLVSSLFFHLSINFYFYFIKLCFFCSPCSNRAADPLDFHIHLDHPYSDELPAITYINSIPKSLS